MPSSCESRISPLWYVLTGLFVLIMFFGALGENGIYAAQEGRTAIIVRNMLRTGNYLDMQIPGGVLYEKPILHYWIVAAPGALLGLAGDPYLAHSEWAVRLPSAVAALLALWAAFLLARGMYGERTALAAVAILACMATFNKLGRIAHLDMLLAAAYAWSMVCFYYGYWRDGKSNGRIYGFYFFLGVAMMIKGPVVAALAAFMVLSLMAFYRRWRLPLELRPWTGVLLFLLVGASWFVFESIRTEGAFFQEFILNQNFRRFSSVGSTYRDGKFMPFYYYVPALLAGTLPWSPVAILGIVFYWKTAWRRSFRPETGFLLAWAVTGFILFSCSALKRIDYLLPLYPALAILTARVAMLCCDARPRVSSRWRILWTAFLGVALLAILLNQSGALLHLSDRIADRTLSFMSEADGLALRMYSEMFSRHIWLGLFAVAGMLALLRYGLHLLESRRTFAAFALLASLIGILFAGYNIGLDPYLSRNKSVRDFTLELRKAIPAGECVVFTGDFNTELMFYLDRPYSVNREGDGGDYVLTNERRGKRLLETRKFILILRTPENNQYPVLLLKLLCG